MKNANLRITTRQLGGQETFDVPCTVETQDDSLIRILYKNSGDDCEIVISDGGLKMIRKGKMPLDMSFKMNGGSSCTFVDGEYHGQLECFTKSIEIEQFAYGIKITLNYTLMGIPMLLKADIEYN